MAKLPLEPTTTEELHGTTEYGAGATLRATPRSEVFHYSRLPSSEYLKAPLLHVGSAEQAATRATYNAGGTLGKWFVPEGAMMWSGKPATEGVTPPSERGGVTKYTISSEAPVYPHTVTDEIANRAHAQYLKDTGKEVPLDINYTYSDETTPFTEHHVRKVTDALHSGQVVPYSNTYEMEDSHQWPVGSDKNTMSYIVPNPKLNLQQFK